MNKVAEMWEILREAVLFYMRACTPEELQPANRCAAREKLIQYGRLLQGPLDSSMETRTPTSCRQPGIRLFDEWCPSYRSLPLRGNEEHMDKGDEEGRQMIGVGKSIRSSDRSAVHEGNEREEHRVAEVKEFLMLRPAEDQADADLLRLAVCDVYRWCAPLRDGSVFVIREEALLYENLALDISGIEALLVSAKPAQPPAVPGQPNKRYYCTADVGKMFFTRFGNVSKTKAPL
ncbi:hypothetical protein COCOBI_05-0920 [Coccomyxa sp. Obi]|nr:hypothetical protein COCOBI_05-0920 [Coccomyxa sp. Obi]